MQTMTRRHIGRNERENIIRQLAYLLTFQQTIKELEEHGGDKEVLRRFRTAHTHIDKALTLWLATVSREAQIKIAQEAECYSAGLYLTAKADEHKAKMMKAESEARARALQMIGEGLEPVYELTEMFFANICKGCGGQPNGKPHTECPAYKVFQKMEIPGWQEDVEGCKYKGAGVVE